MCAYALHFSPVKSFVLQKQNQVQLKLRLAVHLTSMYAFCSADFETAEAAATADSDRDPVKLFQRFLGSLKPQPSQQGTNPSCVLSLACHCEN